MIKSLKICKTAILKTLKFENQLNFAKIMAKNLAKMEKPPKIQKLVGKKSGQSLSRDRSTQYQFSQTTPQAQKYRGGKTFWRQCVNTVLLRVVSLVSNLANPF